ncbi:hypothetical protein [Prochlorococcus marinus]|uniref:hypothetical protein n=1 Tax=Prochlorococcus marinus TaxID=1219 RepID=UPI0022B413E9|nr:hypothetical protein [Prochlorococcus marinus]
MNISKFLLIDAALVIAVIPLLFSIQSRARKTSLLSSYNKEDLLRKTSVKLPDKEKLIELERLAKYQGSGIEFDSLIGNWKFLSVWKKDINEEELIFSSLLRIFSANIEFKEDISNEDLPKFSVIASIQLGLFTIKFSGSGYLQGKQPLLTFYLKLIELNSNSNTLLRRSLEEPEEEKKSFFALIALGEACEWLSARGQGGSVITWLKD